MTLSRFLPVELHYRVHFRPPRFLHEKHLTQPKPRYSSSRPVSVALESCEYLAARIRLTMLRAVWRRLILRTAASSSVAIVGDNRTIRRRRTILLAAAPSVPRTFRTVDPIERDSGHTAKRPGQLQSCRWRPPHIGDMGNFQECTGAINGPNSVARSKSAGPEGRSCPVQ